MIDSGNYTDTDISKEDSGSINPLKGSLKRGFSVTHPGKYLPYLIALSFIVVFTGALALLSLRNTLKKPEKANVSAGLSGMRPTATVFLAPTAIELSPFPSIIFAATVSAVPNLGTSPSLPFETGITPVATDTGRLIFVKDGDIYNSNYISYSLMVENATPASDLLSWSPKGNYLAWRVAKEASASSLVVYDRNNNRETDIPASRISVSETLDFAFSPDEKKLAVLMHDNTYKLYLHILDGSNQEPRKLTDTAGKIERVFWIEPYGIYTAGEEGLISLSPPDFTQKTILNQQKIIFAAVSPGHDKMLYFSENGGKYALYIMDIASGKTTEVPEKPENTDMTGTGLSFDALNKGFYPRAVFFPKGDRILAAYYYLPGLPFVGVYDIDSMSFQGISAMMIYPDDVMIDELRLIGSRVNTTTKIPSWQLGVYTIEDDAKLSAIRIIPGGHSPAFYFGE